jgi:hypothetical protein
MSVHKSQNTGNLLVKDYPLRPLPPLLERPPPPEFPPLPPERLPPDELGV